MIEKISPEKRDEASATHQPVRTLSREHLDDLRKKVSKNRMKSKEKIVRVITVPESVMMGFNPRTAWPWGFDGCGDGNSKFILPPGFEFDQRLDELVDELNTVPRVQVAIANVTTGLGITVLVGLVILVMIVLSEMKPVMVLAVLGELLVTMPIIFSIRFFFKFRAVREFIRRLEQRLPPEKGVVHWERLEFGRMEVWNMPFVGHRTGLTERTAIAVELFLSDAKGLDGADVAEERGPRASRTSRKLIAMPRMTDRKEAVEEQAKVQRVTNFLRDVNLGRLSGIVRRNRITFERIAKITDLEWREIGIDRTEVKLVKSNVQRYLEEERAILQIEPRKPCPARNTA